MAEYYRILSYLYRYDKKNKMDCKGFIKAEQKKNGLKITLQIDDERLPEDVKLALCFYGKENENWTLWQLALLESSRHHEETVLFYPAKTLPEGFDIRKQYGVILLCQEILFYGSIWIGDEIPVEELMTTYREKLVSPDADGKDEENHAPGTEHEGEDVRGGEIPGQPYMETGPADGRGVVETEQTNDQSIMETGSADGRGVVETGQTNDRSIMETGPADGRNSAEKTSAILETESSDTAREYQPGREDSAEIDTSGKTMSSADPREEDAQIYRADGAEERENGNRAENQTVREAERLERKLSTEPEDVLHHMWIDTGKKAKPVDNIFNPAFRSGYQISVDQLKALSPEARGLSDNQFLAKGYAIYHHLLAGKVIYGGEERYCVGVPGIYENRERYMAQLYQFPIFLSLTENRIKTGGFGYWLHLLQE